MNLDYAEGKDNFGKFCPVSSSLVSPRGGELRESGGFGCTEAKMHGGVVRFIKECFGGVCQNRHVTLNLIQGLSMPMKNILAKEKPLTHFCKFASFVNKFNPLPHSCSFAVNGSPVGVWNDFVILPSSSRPQLTRAGERGARQCRVHNDGHGKISPTPLPVKNFSPFTFHFSREGKRVAFTLAEVLITLGIIGVVAALTIPPLISKYNEFTTIINLKKTYSELLQVIKLSEAENGDFREWDYPKGYSTGTDEFVQKYFLPYMKNVTKCTNKNYCFKNGDTWTDPRVNVQWIAWPGAPRYKWNGRGMVFAGYTGEMHVPSPPCSASNFVKHVDIVIDVDGNRGHSIVGKDVFYFTLYNFSKKCPWSVGDGKNYGLYLGGDLGGDYPAYKYPYEQVLQHCQNNNYTNCGLAIQMNGWKKPEGYPLRF